jgi:hypothetical protein
VLYHSHAVDEILERIEEYFETVEAGRVYIGEGDTGETEETPSPVLDSCEAATV